MGLLRKCFLMDQELATYTACAREMHMLARSPDINFPSRVLELTEEAYVNAGAAHAVFRKAVPEKVWREEDKPSDVNIEISEPGAKLKLHQAKAYLKRLDQAITEIKKATTQDALVQFGSDYQNKPTVNWALDVAMRELEAPPDTLFPMQRLDNIVGRFGRIDTVISNIDNAIGTAASRVMRAG